MWAFYPYCSLNEYWIKEKSTYNLQEDFSVKSVLAKEKGVPFLRFFYVKSGFFCEMRFG